MKGRKKNLRLYVVGGFFVLITLVIWIRLVQVQVFARSHYSNIATSQWKVRKVIPPVRGGIFDREGRPLALSIRSCSVSLRPPEIKNSERVVAVLAKQLGVSKRSLRKKVRSKKSFLWVKRQCSLTEKAQEDIKRLKGVDLHWEADRVYPYGDVASKLVGFIGHDNKGMAGVEAALDDDLRGEPGWEIVQRDGAYRSKGYYTYAQKKPMNGRHVVLTIDMRLQEIAEFELDKAIKKSGAKSGAVIVMDCKSGELLSLAESPSPKNRIAHSGVDSLWTIRSISYIYEPGSTFKLVTAGALLETDNVKTFDVFDAENGKADLGAAIISDSHPYGHLTFREAFVFSSNIVMAKASRSLDRPDFMKFVRLFGFGSKTGIRLLGESPGYVAPIEEWSDRTQITMAFGQEIAVTPLQMVNAFAAIANEGEMMVPMVVQAVVDEDTEKKRDYKPVKIRNVVTKETARRLRGFCRSVVEEGTGTNAELTFIKTSGKTGTAEKASPRGGYIPNKYIASFIGFAPENEPKIVCLVMLDEPSYANRFGGVSAAPVFARITSALANSTQHLDGALESAVIDEEDGEGNFKTPNFLRLVRDEAMRRARQLELNVMVKGQGDEVVAQDPDPDILMDRDQVVRLVLGGVRNGDAAVNTPDLRGLPMRAARRRAVEAGFRCAVVGSGVVTSQTPSPGQLSKSGTIKVFCKDQTSGKLKG